MKSIKLLVTQGRAKAVAATTFGILAVGSAFAQTTGGGSGLDYGTSIDAFKGDMVTFWSTNGGKLLAVLVVMLAFGIVWKLVKKAAKSV